MQDSERLRKNIEKQARRTEQAEKDRPTVLAQTVFLGTLALLFVLPVVGGVYLGSWLDGLREGYSYRWTMSLLVTGVLIGAINVYLTSRGIEWTSRNCSRHWPLIWGHSMSRHCAHHLATDGIARRSAGFGTRRLRCTRQRVCRQRWKDSACPARA
jgi:ATP synthase protein I